MNGSLPDWTVLTREDVFEKLLERELKPIIASTGFWEYEVNKF